MVFAKCIEEKISLSAFFLIYIKHYFFGKKIKLSFVRKGNNFSKQIYILNELTMFPFTAL